MCILAVGRINEVKERFEAISHHGVPLG